MTLTNALATTPAIDIKDMGRGALYVPATVTSATYYGCRSEDGTFELIQDAGTAGVDTITADAWNKIPDAAMDLPYIKIVINQASMACEITCKGG